MKLNTSKKIIHVFKLMNNQPNIVVSELGFYKSFLVKNFSVIIRSDNYGKVASTVKSNLHVQIII